MSDIIEISKPLKSVRFASPEDESTPCHFHRLTDEFIIEVGKYLLPTQTKSIPSCRPHFENYQHPFELKLDYNDYLSLREACHKTSYLLKPIKKELEIEIKSKSDLQRWLDAPQEILDGVIRLRVNFTLSPEEDLPTVSTKLWNDFMSLLGRLSNLLELYLTETPFCWHGRNGQKMLFQLPEWPDEDHSPFESIQTLAIEVKCRCCAEHFIGLTDVMAGLKHLKCTTDDSVQQDDMREDAYDFLLTVSYLPRLETLYLKWWSLNMFGEEAVSAISECFPKLRKLYFSTHAREAPYTLCQRARLECIREQNNADGWQSILMPEKNQLLQLGSSLAEFAEEWSGNRYMEEVDYGFLLNLPEYTTHELFDAPVRKRGEATTDNLPLGSDQPSRLRRVSPVEYTVLYKDAIVSAAKEMKENWPSLERVHFWQDKQKRADSPTRDYVRWTAIIEKDTQGAINVVIDPPQVMKHELTWSDEGTVPPDVEEICDQRSRLFFPRRNPESTN
ncbi:uncharacterized protein I303_107128 [Kwoniella dejecticola CBS 10117]|uniref:Uncharacterized protein n=1 Tax=Kwoniella dejecticola CBS 10117 TaxID=1296121 RepID=A0A1A5ZYU0_9TREE|nr:uncharacterized protein I303_06530 [Kwoniella dejecticola CBS 10117]OBR82972.1 hypothetical protein I303_06530 [Kwoniella dejecticola CBS 10117]